MTYQQPSDENIPGCLSAASAQLRQFVRAHPDQAASTLTTLLKLLDGVLRNPKDASRRRIRLANPSFHSRVGQFKEPMEFLKAVSEAVERVLMIRVAGEWRQAVNIVCLAVAVCQAVVAMNASALFIFFLGGLRND